jgi:hypothetical protein
LTEPLFSAKIQYHFNNQKENAVAALFPIEPIISKAEEGERVIESLIARGDSLSNKTALVVADQMIDMLIKSITGEFFTEGEKLVVVEHLTALGIVAIGRTDDIIIALIRSHGDDFGKFISSLCEMRLSFAASEHDEISWIRSLTNEFLSGEYAASLQ